MLTGNKYETFKADIATNGLHEPIQIYKGKILDGRNRYRACVDLKIKPIYREWEGEGSPLAFVISANLARRHLNESQRAMVAARLANMDHGGDRPSKNDSNFEAANLPLRKISQSAAAALLSVSARSVRTAKTVLESGDGLVSKVDAGELSISKANKELKTRKRKNRLLGRQKQAEKNKQDKQPRYTLVTSPIETLELPDNSVDAVITDPPYSRKYLPLYGKLSQLASKVLKDSGICIVMTGQSYLKEVIELLSSHLTYQWTLAYFTPGSSVQVFGRKIKSNWKPLIFLTKGKNTWEHIDDVIKSNERDKEYHEWGQSVGGMTEIIDKFTVKSQVVLDPFCGAGTTGVACLLTERIFVGADSSKDEITKSRKRLKEIR